MQNYGCKCKIAIPQTVTSQHLALKSSVHLPDFEIPKLRFIKLIMIK